MRREPQDHLKRNRAHKRGIVGTNRDVRVGGRMNWLPLESEMLTSVAYDEEQQMLQLRFRGTGDVYCYFEVPVTKYEASSMPSPTAASSSRTSAATSATSAWLNSRLLDQVKTAWTGRLPISVAFSCLSFGVQYRLDVPQPETGRKSFFMGFLSDVGPTGHAAGHIPLGWFIWTR